MTLKKILIAIILVLFIGHLTDVRAESAQELTISAAISLKNVLEEIGKLYEAKNRGVKVIFNFGASGILRNQIQGGAPVDIFISADLTEMNELKQRGFIMPDSLTVFASNDVVLIVPKDYKGILQSFNDLRKPDIKKLAIGNPRTVPAGRYAENIFEYFNLAGILRDKIILSENVRQVLDYVARGEVDAGIVYSTDAAVRLNEVKIALKASEESHKPVIYPAAIIKGTKRELPAKDFISFMTSRDSESVLKRYGFGLTRKKNQL